MCESCVAPILIAMVAAWYPKNEQSTRIASFYVMNGSSYYFCQPFAYMTRRLIWKLIGLTMIFGGLLAYGVTFYAGNKIEHWRVRYSELLDRCQLCR